MSLNPLKVLVGDKEATEEVKSAVEEALKESTAPSPRNAVDALYGTFGGDVIVSVVADNALGPLSKKLSEVSEDDLEDALELCLDLPTFTVSIGTLDAVVKVGEDENSVEENEEINGNLLWKWFVESPGFARFIDDACVNTFLVVRDGLLTTYGNGEFVKVYEKHKEPWVSGEMIYVLTAKDGIVRVA